MAYCFQAQLYTNLDKPEKAEKLWENCLQYARPETTGEYQWFFVVGKPTLAGCIDTDSIIAGGPEQSDEYIKTCWNNILESGELSVEFEGISAQ